MAVGVDSVAPAAASATRNRARASLPRLLLVERLRYRFPLEPWLAAKFDALGEVLEIHVLACRDPSSDAPWEGFRLVPPSRLRALDGLLFYLRSPLLIRRVIAATAPDAVMAENPFLGAAALVARVGLRVQRPAIVVEVHGDWRTATRLYGSRLRRLLSRPADLVASAAVRRADAVRAVSMFTSRLVAETRGSMPTACFPAFFSVGDFATSRPRPQPGRPTALFVGSLELYKSIDVLAAAWRAVAPVLPTARLVIVGQGARAEIVRCLQHALPAQVEWEGQLSADAVARRMDEATVLVLPSRSEGYGRVVIESFARARPVIGSDAGSLPELIEHGRNGLLVGCDDTASLAAALAAILCDAGRAAELGRGAYASFLALDTTPSTYARRLRRLTDETLANGTRRTAAREPELG